MEAPWITVLLDCLGGWLWLSHVAAQGSTQLQLVLFACFAIDARWRARDPGFGPRLRSMRCQAFWQCVSAVYAAGDITVMEGMTTDSAGKKTVLCVSGEFETADLA